jgi:arsenate reductase
MAEAILRHLDPVRFESLSAGSHPAGFVHPLVIRVLEDMGIPVEGQYSKSWSEFVGQPIDLVITVCDSAAEEVCPVWPDAPLTIHWPLPDPTFYPGPPEAQADLARRVAEQLISRLKQVIALNWEQLDADQLRKELEKIAEL